MRRFFVNEIFGDDVSLAGAEAKHISRVLRMGPGDKLILFDGSGMDYTAEIVEADPAYVALKVLDAKRSAVEPEIKVTVYQAVLKSDHFAYAVQKCTELGAETIVPFLSARCVKQPKSTQSFVERARRIALEASKQCGRSRVPVVAGVVSFEDVVNTAKSEDGEPFLLAYENEKKTTLKLAVGGKGYERLSVVIGPEGGFEPEEAEAIVAAGAAAVSLGKTILRAETAGPAAVAMILYEYGK